MAKAKKKNQEQAAAVAAEPSKSVLVAAYQAFQRGDMVTARRLCRDVLAGKKGPDDERAAEELSKTLSSELTPVGGSVEDVAKDLLSRTKGPPRPYVFALLSTSIFVLLVVLAATRYAG